LHIELENWRRGNAALSVRRIVSKIFDSLVYASRTVGDPDVVLRIDEYSSDAAQDPAIRKRFGPIRVWLESGHSAGCYGGLVEQGWQA
jgi:hypothetical protein